MEIVIPIPRHGVPGDRPRYPFDKLEIGDSMLVPYQRVSPMSMREAVRSRQNRRPGEAYSVEDTGSHTRVTRVA